MTLNDVVTFILRYFNLGGRLRHSGEDRPIRFGGKILFQLYLGQN